MKNFLQNIITRNTLKTLGLDGSRYQNFFVSPQRSQPIKVVKIPKPKGGFRNIYIYCLYDRIQAQNIYDKVIPSCTEKFIHKRVYGVCGKPVFFAQQKVTRYYNKAFKGKLAPYFFRGDIKNFYDCIDKKIILQKIQDLNLFEQADLDFIRSIVYKDVLQDSLWQSFYKGLHTGLILVNLFANLYLFVLDEIIEEFSKFYVRVGDDFIATFESEEQMKSVFENVVTEIKDLNLEFTYNFGDLRKDEVEFLGYVYAGGKISIRSSSLQRFERTINKRFLTVSGDLPRRKEYFLKKLKGADGLDVYLNSFLDAYRFFNCDKQAKQINQFLMRRINKFIFGYQGLDNSEQLHEFLKSIGFETFYTKFWKLKTGKLRYKQIRKSDFRNA